MAYPTEKRERALELCQKGLTDEQVGERLDISKHTVGTWKKLLFETGSVEKKKAKRKSGTPYKYKPEKIKELLEKSKKQSDTTGTSKSDKIPKFQESKKKDKDKKKPETSTASKGNNIQDFQKPKKKKKKKFKTIPNIY